MFYDGIPKTVQDGLILEEIGSRTKVKVDHEKKIKETISSNTKHVFIFSVQHCTVSR